MKEKKRLDLLVLEKHPSLSRAHIQGLIAQGRVAVDGRVVTKAGVLVAADAVLIVEAAEPKFVSRAGFKVEHALMHFNVDVTDFVVLDAGLSTGGFADCLLQRGAARVYGVDVGYGQVHEKIRHDPRVVVMERVNLRSMAPLPELVDLVTLDLSFISVLKVMDVVVRVLKPKGHLLILIKPQFEARKEQVGRGGIIKDPQVHEEVIARVVAGIVAHGFRLEGVTESPIMGSSGNKEFLAYFTLPGHGPGPRPLAFL